MNSKIIITVLFSLLLNVQVFAQAKALKIADKAYDTGEYFNAITLYKQAFNKIKSNADRAEALFKIGLCYMKTLDPANAEVWFGKSVQVKYTDPLATLYYVDALKQNEKYDEAKHYYEQFSSLAPADVRGENGRKACELAIKWKNKPSRYVVENNAYLNTKESDYSPTYVSDDYTSILITSSRAASGGNDLSGVTGQSFADLYLSTRDPKGKWSLPLPITSLVNTASEEGTPSFAKGGTDLYFTRCDFKKKEHLTCAIYRSPKAESDWGFAEKLFFCVDSLTYAHPSISKDELTLYFTSDMPGGLGGKDIWKVKRISKDSPWEAPINMGDGINTPGDELFPFSREDGSLYFSSNGHIGLGGLDIFRAALDKSGNWVADNLKIPMNSPLDDFGITFEGNYEKGFFSSARKGGKGMDDIYSFILRAIKLNLSGVVVEETSGTPIPDAIVKLIASDGVTTEIKTNSDGTFNFKLKQNQDYILTTVKDGYLNGKGKETTKNIDVDKDFKLDITMAAIENPIGLENIMYDVSKWDLRPESMVSLDKLVDIMNDNPGITIELRSHTDFRDEAENNQILSQKRAQSVVDYLIEKGIEPDRLVAKGYGESMPNIVNRKDSKNFNIPVGTRLTEEYIKALATPEEQEIAHQINRRTEFQVLSTDYKSKNPSTNENTEIMNSDDSVQPIENSGTTPTEVAPSEPQFNEDEFDKIPTIETPKTDVPAATDSIPVTEPKIENQ